MTDPKNLERARQLFAEYAEAGNPLSYFDALYQESQRNPNLIPWARLEPNSFLVSWVEQKPRAWQGWRCLKIGCGLGDDAEYLARLGAVVTAFDISESAISWCKQRFSDTNVSYQVANLLELPPSFYYSFDFVFEAYTIQSMPFSMRHAAIDSTARCVAPGGTLLIVTRGRDHDQPIGSMPWPLSQQELLRFLQTGLEQVQFEDLVDSSSASVRRFRVEYQRSS